MSRRSSLCKLVGASHVRALNQELTDAILRPTRHSLKLCIYKGETPIRLLRIKFKLKDLLVLSYDVIHGQRTREFEPIEHRSTYVIHFRFGFFRGETYTKR